MDLRSTKYPPAMYDPYHEWKNELIAWKHLTDLASAKHGAALLRSLTGDAKKAAQKVPIDSVITDGGWNLILVELDKLFEKDKSASKYIAFDKFIKFRRPDNMSLNDYLRKFEILKNSCESYGTVIPDDILAYNMLECANLSPDRKELVRATLVDLKTSEMREKLRRIFPEIMEQGTSSSLSTTSVPFIKEEPVFHGRDVDHTSEESVMYNNQQCSRSNRGGNRRGRRYNRNEGYSNKQSNSYSSVRTSSRMNPIGSNGLVMTCDCCGSVYHFIKKCPDNKHQNTVLNSQNPSTSNRNRYI